MNSEFDQARVRKLNAKTQLQGPVIYWMSRDQRLEDNWALICANQKALAINQPLVLLFCITDNFFKPYERHFSFLMDGVESITKESKALNLDLFVVVGDPTKEVVEFSNQINAGSLICDFSPLRRGREWRESIAKKIDFEALEVDSHNIVPAFYVSNKEEYGAYTLRPKINKLLPRFLTDYPRTSTPKNIEKSLFSSDYLNEKVFGWHKEFSKEIILDLLKVDKSVKKVTQFSGGSKHALETVQKFISIKVTSYELGRNDPSLDFQSNLSPYLHFGHVSAQRIAIEVKKRVGDNKNTQAFLEELIIRKELADNFCLYNTNYDKLESCPKWALNDLKKHENDKRDYVYSLEEFEEANTHDLFWNSAQNEMRVLGKMHGYMRMYWAKKILEWSKSPEEAFNTAVYLNDKYELDGRDPNGYAGIAWAIGGKHDRPWFERPIFGKIRYMNQAGAEKKFDTNAYIEKIKQLA